MTLAGRERLATGVGFAAIGVIAAMVWWTSSEVDYANGQRRATSEIARGLTEVSLVTVEYRQHRNERTRVQWGAALGRVDKLLASAQFKDPVQAEILAGLRERRKAAGPGLFAAITAAGDAGRADAVPGDTGPRFEALLLTELTTYQHENIADAFLLTSLATDRILDAQRRLVIVILGGLVLLASTTAGTSWFLRRGVLAPLAGLQHATRQVAAGNWDVVLDTHRVDEIGDLSKDFGDMTRALRTSFVHAQRSNKDLTALNEELEAFSYSVSHDLRGPLRSMDGFSLVLIEDYGGKLDAEGKDALERIRAASQRMGHLIDDLLRLSRVTRAGLNVTQVDLSAIARAIADALEREQPGRTVDWAIEPGLTVNADHALMRIAMQNLLQNAWKFTGNAERAVIRVGALKRGSKTEYFVADNGAGFDMAYAGSLFGAFQRLHSASDFPGAGIGLAIVQRIIRRHDGEIRAEAKEGEGATFSFTLHESGGASNEQDHPAG